MLLTKSKIFLVAVCFFSSGIFFASLLPVAIIGQYVFWLLGLVGSAVLIIIFLKIKIKEFPLWILFLWLVFLFLGFWRYSLSIPTDSPDKIWHYNNQDIIFTGLIDQEPDLRATNQKLEIEVKSIFLPAGEFAAGGRVLITADLYPVFYYGDAIKVECLLEKVEEFNDFSYDRYLARHGIYSLCYRPQIESLGSGQGVFFYDNIFSFKEKLRAKINYALDWEEAALLKAILLGDKKSLSDDWREIFSRVGLSHIVAISGMHIGILAGLAMYGLLGMGISRRKSFYLAVIFLTAYIILVGAPASAVRAGVMGFMFLLAIHVGRLKKTANALAFAAFVMLMINPRLLYDDVGFQLSFLAVLGISIFYPRAVQYLENKPIKIPTPIRDILLITFAAQIFTWPVIAFNFSNISFISPVSNLLVVWTLPFLIIAAIIGLVFSFFLPFWSPVFFLPAKIVLDYILTIAEWLEQMPGGYKEVYYFPTVIMILYYFIIFLFLRSKSKS